MNGRLQALAARRTELVERSDRERTELATAFGGIERRFILVEAGVAAARRMNRHRVVLGAFAVWSVLAPIAARLWIKRLAWWVPLAIEGYRVTKKFTWERRSARVEA